MSRFVLKLYVAGRTPRTESAISSLKEICDRDLSGLYELSVIDVLERPQLAENEKILATPTLVKELPPPLRRVVAAIFRIVSGCWSGSIWLSGRWDSTRLNNERRGCRGGGRQEIATGIAGFDYIANSGLPDGRTALVAGTPAAARRSSPASSWQRACAKGVSSGVFVTFEEKPQDSRRNIKYGWGPEAPGAGCSKFLFRI